MYIDCSLRDYIDELAGRKPTPGGGSAAGLCGALGTALLEMVCNFTAGNERYKDVEPEILKNLEALKKIREGLAAAVDEDVKAYAAIRSAFKTKDEKHIDNALKDGYHICLKICRLSKSGLDIAPPLAEKGNINLVTDVGCGAELLNAAFNSAIFNCEVNLKGMTDKAFREKERTTLNALAKETEVLYKRSIAKTREGMR